MSQPPPFTYFVCPTKADIEKAAKYLGELVTPEMRHSETVKVIIQQVNAALNEAAVLAEEYSSEIAEEIEKLKIKEREG